MSSISFFCVSRHISESKAVESSVARYAGVDGGGWEEDGPGDDPDRKEDANEHAEEADEEVRVHAIHFFNFAVIGLPDGPWPQDDRRRQRVLAFARVGLCEYE